VVAGVGATLATGVAGLLLHRRVLALDLAGARKRWSTRFGDGQHPWPLAAVVLVCGAWTVHFLHQAYVYTPVGLFAGYVNIWGDWAAQDRKSTRLNSSH